MTTTLASARLAVAPIISQNSDRACTDLIGGSTARAVCTQIEQPGPMLLPTQSSR